MPLYTEIVDTVLDYRDITTEGGDTVRVAVPLSDIQVTVLRKGTVNPADTNIYEDEGTIEKDNPFTTVNGLWSFYAAEAQQYVIQFEDTQTPARIAPFEIMWSPGILSPPPQITPVFRTASTYPIQGDIKAVSGNDYVLPPFEVPESAASQTVKLIYVRTKVMNGAADTRVTFTIRRNNVQITGLTGVQTGANANWNTHDITDLDLTDKDELYVSISGVTGTPKNMSVEFVFEHTLS